MRYQGRNTVAATTATHVAQRTTVVDRFVIEKCSSLWSNSSFGCFSNSSTSTSKRKRTFDEGDSLRQTKWPEDSRRSRLHLGSCTERRTRVAWLFQRFNYALESRNQLSIINRAIKDAIRLALTISVATFRRQIKSIAKCIQISNMQTVF